MQCPVCSARNGVEVDIHAEGYARNIMECAGCGAVWTTSLEGTVGLIRNAA